VGGIVDHKKDQATSEGKKYLPYIFCGGEFVQSPNAPTVWPGLSVTVGALVVIGIAWYIWRRHKNRKNKALSSSAGDERLGDK
jgi:hypothetical protein